MRAILLLLLVGFSFSAFSLERTAESLLKKGDHRWENNQLKGAAKSYQRLIKRGKVPEAFQSLVYLRLAELQLADHQPEACRQTLKLLKDLPILPAFDRLKGKELEDQLNGLTTPEETPLPTLPQVVKTFKVRTGHTGSDHYVTLQQAADAAGQWINQSKGVKGTVEIALEDDTIQLTQPVRLTAAHSGNSDLRLWIHSTSKTARTIINGGKKLTYWHVETDPRITALFPAHLKGKLWVADLKENQVVGIDSLVLGGFSSRRAAGKDALFASFPVPELFQQGVPQTMARWPNDRDTSVTLKNFKDPRIFRWAADGEVWLHGYWYYLWADAYEKMAGASPSDTTIAIAPPINGYGFGKSKWHALNALSELDQPGEWALSTKRGKIWYRTPGENQPSDLILSVSGPALVATQCNFLTVQGLDLQYLRGDGLIFKDCSQLTLFDCYVCNTSGLAFKVDGGDHHLLHSCAVNSMGRGGIEINSGDKLKLVPSESLIENCVISNLSRIDRTYTPAILLQGDAVKVRHCRFTGIPSSGIRLEGNDMLVEKNIFSYCVTESDDQGAIDTWGNPLYRGNVIRWNLFSHVGVPDLHMAAGVRLDDAISGFSICENLFLRSSNNHFGGVQIHGGKDNHVIGNLFAECHVAISQSPWGDKNWLKAIADPTHPMYKAMHTTDWQSQPWMSRYPALKNLETDADHNFAADNRVFQPKSFFLRASKRFESLNNQVIDGAFHPQSAIDFQPEIVPWHPIPLETIGPYPLKSTQL